MKTSDFINLFKTGRLGKKRQHAGYKVMDGDHCQLLVRSIRSSGAPGGSELIGIYFGNDICIFHNNFNGIRDSVTNYVSDPKPVVTGDIIKAGDPNLIDSGIIEIDDNKQLLLLEIGTTPWLLENDPKYTPDRYNNWAWSYNTGTQLSKRVETIEEVEKDVVLDEGVISTIGYLLKVMPSDFVPVSTSEEDKKLLMNPPNPFNYGVTLDDLVIKQVFVGASVGATPLYVKKKVVSSSRGAQFKVDIQTFNQAVKRFQQREPSAWENITKEDNGTIIIGANEQVYLKGHVYHRYKSSEKADFHTWHQVLGKTSKIRLPIL